MYVWGGCEVKHAQSCKGEETTPNIPDNLQVHCSTYCCVLVEGICDWSAGVLGFGFPPSFYCHYLMN